MAVTTFPNKVLSRELKLCLFNSIKYLKNKYDLGSKYYSVL